MGFPSYLLNIVFVQKNRSVVEKRMIEGVWKQPTELHSSTTVQRRPAMLQTEADEAESAHSNTEEQQIMLLLSLIPASLWDEEKAQISLMLYKWQFDKLKINN